MRKLLVLITGLFLLVSPLAKADEGMWLPLFVERLNYTDMQEMGLQLTAEEIYSINNSSLKDAIIIFGGGCTGEIVSDQGLIFTNHHCGYGYIQAHSTVEHDYLTEGFWARSFEEELPNEGIKASFLVRIEDVTNRVLEVVNDQMSEGERAEAIGKISKEIEKEAVGDTHYQADVKSFFHGNEYYLFVYEVYTDVRLVGTPPSSIGKFGGDTDNWMWPRHTGDFSVFRIYADKDNQPAEYSKDNVPYQPEKFFPVSMKGVQTNDFTMILGYPGRTTGYLPSRAVSMVMDQGNPDKIKIRDKKLEILSSQMNADRKVRIQYAAKYAGISNSWKRWQGEIKGLRRLDAIREKKDFEAGFTAWINENDLRQKTYGQVLADFDDLYSLIGPYAKARDYFNEIVANGCDVFKLASLLDRSVKAVECVDQEKREILKTGLLEELEKYFKDYDRATDEKMFLAMLHIYRDDLNKQFLPVEFIRLMDKTGDQKLKQKIYGKSVLTDQAKLTGLVEKMPAKGLKALKNDPLIELYCLLRDFYKSNVAGIYASLDGQIQETQKLYMKGIMEMRAGERIYPDANYTLRVGYGKVEGYEPADGVEYDCYSTIDGIMEKDNPEIYDYNVPEKFRELYGQKNFGQYAVNGTVPVCFVASNHTTGGNSGSPVINANGELIGVNFDRCWEGTMSDIMFDPDRCRNIVLDIRYALFIIDKLAGAGYLLDEMQLSR